MIVYSACFAVGTVPYTLLLVYIYISIYTLLLVGTIVPTS